MMPLIERLMVEDDNNIQELDKQNFTLTLPMPVEATFFTNRKIIRDPEWAQRMNARIGTLWQCWRTSVASVDRQQRATVGAQWGAYHIVSSEGVPQFHAKTKCLDVTYSFSPYYAYEVIPFDKLYDYDSLVKGADSIGMMSLDWKERAQVLLEGPGADQLRAWWREMVDKHIKVAPDSVLDASTDESLR